MYWGGSLAKTDPRRCRLQPCRPQEAKTMALRLPLRPSHRSTRTLAHDPLTLGTRKPRQFFAIADQVHGCMRRSGITDGAATVRSMRTTAAILINENEPLFLEDPGQLRAASLLPEWRYPHDDSGFRTASPTPDERPNGHAHARSMTSAPRFRMTCSC